MSLSILLADDEPLVTQAIKVLISESEHDVTVVGEVHDGNKALNFIRNHQPDIVLLDIRMPYKNGFQILEEIEANHYETKVVILSAYRDFEYAQKALHFGAVEYLTKPINKASLDATLHKLTRICNQEKIIHSATTLHYIDTLQKGGTAAKKQFEQWGFWDGASTQNIQLCMLAFPRSQTYEDYKSYKKRKAEWANYLYILWINEHYWVLIYKAGYVDIISNIETIRTSLHQIQTYAGISAVMDCTLFPTAYKQAMAAVQHSFYHPDIFSFSFTDFGELSHENNISLISKVITSSFSEKIDLGNTEETENIVHDWFYHARHKELHPLLICANLKSLLNYLWTRNIYISKELEEILQGGIEFLSSLIASQYYTNIDNLESWTIEIIKKISDNSQNTSNLSNQQRIIQKVKSYCERHYKEDISLDSITQEIHITKSWFCSLFKKETGQTFGNYLTELRLKKATVLLVTSETKINQIAENVGYKNPSHFNHAFMEKYNVTPLEYRRMHWNKPVE